MRDETLNPTPSEGRVLFFRRPLIAAADLDNTATNVKNIVATDGHAAQDLANQLRDLNPVPPAPLQLTLDDLVSPNTPPNATIAENFAAFHEANPHIYRELRRLALDLHARGRKRISIGMLFEVLRWSALRTRPDIGDYKLNNNYRSRYARLLADTNPALADAFELRTLRTQ